ncbi:MAG: hypothetical protein EZS28_014675 [Streblomastix strix]|uniref:Uncharacterized protein n=1 Tax=Streblomastix strix TaxID=222440 RepID=A0A5J4W4M9_9EUKA|nr:MAG: hypothetical protein EZS28_014675 [Streblomastix strix]
MQFIVVVVDLGNRYYSCEYPCITGQYFNVEENYLGVTCVYSCPIWKTDTTLPSGVKKCVDSCPAGQSRFKYCNGTYTCHTSCTGFQKALELNSGTIRCVDNNCTDTSQVLKIDPYYSNPGYYCTSDCYPQSNYTFDDDGTQVCVDSCDDEQSLYDNGQAQPMCFDTLRCPTNQTININDNNQIECASKCSGNRIRRIYENNLIMCVNSCPADLMQLHVENDIYQCEAKTCPTYQQQQYYLKYSHTSKLFFCQAGVCNPTFVLDNGRDVCTINCDASKIQIDVGLDAPICINKCATNQYYDVDYDTNSYSCVSACPFGKSQINSGNGIIKCVDKGSHTYYVDPNSRYQHKDCNFAHPCKALDETNFAYTLMSEPVGHLVYFKSNYVHNNQINIGTTSSDQRLLTSYPSGGTNQYNIDVTSAGMFYVTQGWLAFQTVKLRVNANYNSQNCVISLNGNLAKLDLINCIFAGITTSNIDRGIVKCMNQATLNIDRLTVNAVNMAKDSIINMDQSSGIVSISNSLFNGVNRLAGTGAVIQANLRTQSGEITILSNTSFENCRSKYSNTVQYDIGAIYINILQDASNKFDFSGVVYKTSSTSYFGKGLFIEADNLAEVIKKSNNITKFGTIQPNPSINEMYMMGIESSRRQITIPLQYTVNNVTSGIYHIFNPNITTWNYSVQTKGNDNEFCGWVRFPCLSFVKAVSRSIAQHPEINFEVKISMVSVYSINTTQDIDAQGRKVSISYPLDYSTEAPTQTLVDIQFREAGQLSFSNGSLSLISRTLKVINNNTKQYIILMNSNSKSLEIKSCTFAPITSGQTLKSGLVEVNGGSVNIESLTVNTVTLSACNLIKLNSGTGQVKISSSTFTNVQSSGSNGGSVIFGEVNRSCAGINLSNLTFTGCRSTATAGKTYGGAIQLYVSGVAVDINSVQFSTCSGSKGGGMFISLDQQSSLKFSNNSKFLTCTDSSLFGGGAYFDIQGHSTVELDNVKFDTCTAQQFGGGIYSTISSGCTLTITNATTFTNCTCILNQYQEGGAVTVIIQDTSSKFQVIGSSSFNNCSSKGFGGAISVNGSLGSLINIKSVSFTSCSGEGGGGLNALLQTGAVLKIEDSTIFFNCTSASLNGGGIRAIITGTASSLYISGSSTFDQCKTTSGQGGGIYISASQSKVINISTVLFDKCDAIQGGGAISTILNDGASLTIDGLTNFTTCKSTRSTNADIGGGAIYADVQGVSTHFRIIGTSKFDHCSSPLKGGAIYVKSELSQSVEINKAAFISCSSIKEGGGIYAYINNGGSFVLTNGSTFTGCQSTTDSGGGLYAIVKTASSGLQITDGVTFDGCLSEKQGGGIYISIESSKINEINKMIVTGCKAKQEGSGLYIDINKSAQLKISNETSFTNCVSSNSAGSSGGGIYAKVKDADTKLIITNQVKFDNCDSLVTGGGMYLLITDKGSVELAGSLLQNCDSPKGAGIYAQIQSGSQLSVLNTNQFKTCKATGTTEGGGGLYASIDADCKLYIQFGVIFDSCTSNQKGGGAYLIAKDRSSVDMNKVTFQSCTSVSGGGAVFIDMVKSASLVITNSSLFKDCITSTGNGGGIFSTIKDLDSRIIIQDGSKFETCRSTFATGKGGAAYIELQLNASVIINRAQFITCSAFDGGAIHTSLLAESTFTISNQSLFQGCSSTGNTPTSGGGGINANIDSFSKFIIQSSTQFDTCICTTGKGGAGYFVVQNKGSVKLSQTTFKTCSSINGGGLYITLQSEASLTVTKANQFTGCTTTTGSGGGLYATVKDPNTKIFIEDNSRFFECKSILGQGGGAYIDATLQTSIEISRAQFDSCESSIGGGIFCSVLTGAQLSVTNSSLFYGCKASNQGGGLYTICDDTNSKLNISGFTQFDLCQTTGPIAGPNGQGGGSYLKITNNASFELNKVTYKDCSAFEGGGMYGEIENANRFIITSSNQFISCNSIERGGAMYLNFPNNSSYNFIVGSLTIFKENIAGQCGRDIFFYCNNFNYLEVSRRLLYDVLSPLYDVNKALYGTEYLTQVELSHDPESDYDLINRYVTCFADTLYISNLYLQGNDEESCGDKGSACSSFTYARTKFLTPEWRPQTLLAINGSTHKVTHTYVAVGQMQILEPLTSEADDVILRGATHDEIDSVSVGYHSKVQFGERGQIVCSDLARWQEEEGNEFAKINGVNQKFTLQQLEFVLPEQMEVKSLILVKGNPSIKGRGREVEVLIQDCKVSQEPSYPIVVQTNLFKSEPYLSSKEKIIFDNLVSDPALPDDGIQLSNGSLIEINYEPNIVLKEKYLQFQNCFFKYVKSLISSWIIKETPEEKINQVPYGAGSILTIRGSSASYIPLHFVDCTFENCEMNMQVKTNEMKFLGIGGAVGIFGMNIHLVLEHFKFVDCSATDTFISQSQSSVNSEDPDENIMSKNSLNQSSLKEYLSDQLSNVSTSNDLKKPNFKVEISGGLYIGLAGVGAEGRFVAKQNIAKYLKENGEQRQDLSPLIDTVHKPIIRLDSCVIKTCKTFIVNSGRGFRVIQSGGVIIHTDRIGAQIDFKSSIFDRCLSQLSQINSSSNIADIESMFEPLWDRELRIGEDGGGLIVTHGVIKPNIRGKGVQFINCTATKEQNFLLKEKEKV